MAEWIFQSIHSAVFIFQKPIFITVYAPDFLLSVRTCSADKFRNRSVEGIGLFPVASLCITAANAYIICNDYFSSTASGGF